MGDPIQHIIYYRSLSNCEICQCQLLIHAEKIQLTQKQKKLTHTHLLFVYQKFKTARTTGIMMVTFTRPFVHIYLHIDKLFHTHIHLLAPSHKTTTKQLNGNQNIMSVIFQTFILHLLEAHKLD